MTIKKLIEILEQIKDKELEICYQDGEVGETEILSVDLITEKTTWDKTRSYISLATYSGQIGCEVVNLYGGK